VKKFKIKRAFEKLNDKRNSLGTAFEVYKERIPENSSRLPLT